MFNQDKLQQIELFMLDGIEASDWYEKAHEAINDLARMTETDAGMIADIVAILSPRVQVSRNCKLALEWIFKGTATGAMDSRVKACELYIQNNIVSGPKVSCFAQNLRGNYDEITVDVWIAKAFDVDFGTITDAQRDGIKAVIRDLADHHGLTPAAVQAAVWVGVRKDHGLTDSEGALIITDHLDHIA